MCKVVGTASHSYLHTLHLHFISFLLFTYVPKTLTFGLIFSIRTKNCSWFIILPKLHTGHPFPLNKTVGLSNHSVLQIKPWHLIIFLYSPITLIFLLIANNSLLNFSLPLNKLFAQGGHPVSFYNDAPVVFHLPLFL